MSAASLDAKPTVHDLASELGEVDFRPGPSTPALQSAVQDYRKQHSGVSFARAVTALTEAHADLAARANPASLDELRAFLKKGGDVGPAQLRRVEKAVTHRIPKDPTGPLPPLAVVVEEEVADQQAVIDRLKERERQIKQEQEAEANRLAQDMKDNQLLAAVIPAWRAEIFDARQELKPLEEAHRQASEELRRVQESGEKPARREVWSDGTPIHQRESNIEAKYRDGQQITRVTRSDPWPELEKAKAKAQEASKAYHEADARVNALIHFGAAIGALPTCSIRFADLLEERAGMALGYEWHRAGEVTDGISGDAQFRKIVVTSAPKAKKTGGFFK
ncbi:MAG TPA: hypothetical protein VMO47_10505 [Rhodothermales bacterium]|nr:hypothetical protein [Rhodothermales bacterium]